MTGQLSLSQYKEKYVGRVNPRRKVSASLKINPTLYPSIKKVMSGSNVTGYVIGGKIYAKKGKQNSARRSKQPWEQSSRKVNMDGFLF
jgi:hypothetical protein